LLRYKDNHGPINKRGQEIEKLANERTRKRKKWERMKITIVKRKNWESFEQRIHASIYQVDDYLDSK
jgi:hypothetical protein